MMKGRKNKINKRKKNNNISNNVHQVQAKNQLKKSIVHKVKNK